jgi:hypothetical protein
MYSYTIAELSSIPDVLSTLPAVQQVSPESAGKERGARRPACAKGRRRSGGMSPSNRGQAKGRRYRRRRQQVDGRKTSLIFARGTLSIPLISNNFVLGDSGLQVYRSEGRASKHAQL